MKVKSSVIVVVVGFLIGLLVSSSQWDSRLVSVSLLFCLFLLALPVGRNLLKRDTDVFEAINIVGGVYVLYFGLPFIYFLFRGADFVDNPELQLIKAILLAIIGFVSLYVGYYSRLATPTDW